MKKWLACLSILSLNSLVASDLNALGHRNEFIGVIYYIPFHVETYVPVTPETIEATAHQKVVLYRESELLNRLKDELTDNQIPGRFDDRTVRLKVRLKRRVFLVDSDGGVKAEGGEYKINPDTIEDLVRKLTQQDKLN